MIKPLYDNVVVRRKAEDEKSAGGIILLESSKDKPCQGEVISVGAGMMRENGEVRPPCVKVGDIVVFGEYAGNAIKIDGDEVIIMRENEIYGVIDE